MILFNSKSLKEVHKQVLNKARNDSSFRLLSVVRAVCRKIGAHVSLQYFLLHNAVALSKALQKAGCLTHTKRDVGMGLLM